MPDDRDLLPFEEGGENSRLIRRQWHESSWYFSVVDVVALLTDTQIPRNYWSDLKRRLAQEEGFAELHAKIVQLKMRALDGKMRVTDASDVETMLRIVQSIPSPKAEPVKQWLAQVGTQHLTRRCCGGCRRHEPRLRRVPRPWVSRIVCGGDSARHRRP